MKTPMITKEKIDVDVASELLSFAMKFGITIGALIGIWGVSCLVSGLSNVGGINLVQGFITALTGG